MPRSRGSEMAQRQSPRGPLQLRTSSSESDPLHHRPVTDRSPKVGNHRSPRGAQSDPLNQRKLGTRIADLESQLGQAQDELKSLKGQLASAEAAKKAAQDQLEKKTKKPTVVESEKIHETSNDKNNNDSRNNLIHEIPDDDEMKETDVFEVPVEKVNVEPPPNVEINHPSTEEDLKRSSVSPAELKEPSSEELSLKAEEISSLKSKLEEKEKELQVLGQENESLKKELNEKMLEISSVKSKEDEMSLKLNQVTQELETSKNDGFNMKEKLEATEKAKEALETEMKKLRVQTEQWRKAADAAAAVLAGGGVEMNGRRLPERCGSMDKHYGSVFEPAAGGYGSYMGSPGFADASDDVFGHGKRKGSGIKMFGDLWKKKGHK